MTSNIQFNSNPRALQTSQQTIPIHPIQYGLSSIPSYLHERASPSASNESCIQSLINAVIECIKKIVSCFIPAVSEARPIPTGPLSIAAIQDRIAIAKRFADNQLRLRIDDSSGNYGNEWTPLGIRQELINGSKVVVIINYNNKAFKCTSVLNGQNALLLLSAAVHAKIENLIRSPENQAAQVADLSITTMAFHWQRTSSRNGERLSALDDQSKNVTLNPDNSFESRGGCDGNCSSVTRTRMLESFRDKGLSASEIAELDGFLYS